MDFKYKDTSVFACNCLIFFYLKGTKARSADLEGPRRAEGRKPFTSHLQTLSTNSTCSTLRYMLQGGPKALKM